MACELWGRRCDNFGNWNTICHRNDFGAADVQVAVKVVSKAVAKGVIAA